MIKKEFSGSARRARNIIWNAAGRYDFEPPFMAFFPNGVPDHYFNMVVGLVKKWLDLDRIWAFFAEYEGDHRAEEFDEFLWLGLENCVYEKEVQERPILESLRRQRAARFYKEQESLTRQQMEYQSMPVYTQQEARWSRVLGRRGPVLTPKEARMAEALCFSGELDTEAVISAMQQFLAEFFRYQPGKSPIKKGRANPLARFFLRHEHQRRDHFLVRTGTGEGDHPRAVTLGHAGLGKHHAPTEEDAAYIWAVFGRCAVTENELRILQNDLCVGEDADCRVWITKGEPAQDAPSFKEAEEIRRARDRQRESNEAFRKEHAVQMQGAVKALSVRVETMLASYLRHLPEPARAGRICPEKAYRLPLLQDGRVFLKDGEDTEAEIFVDLLLDASQSRMNSQEMLSVEAWIVAQSLVKLHVPVRVCAFRSLRGYTVLEELKTASEKDCNGIFRYYAGGWNRDALALKTLGRLEDDPLMQGKQRILLVMTDASPNDSTPAAATDRLVPREYEGALGVRAAEEAVRHLRKNGLRVGAVFHGNPSHLGDLNQIYGHANVRIRKASQLAQGVSDLLLMLLREMQTD